MIVTSRPRALSIAVSLVVASGGRAAEFAANHLFVIDRATDAIRELDPAGNVVRVFANGVLLDPQAMAFGPDGLLYVLDDRASEPSFDRIFVFSPEGDTLDSHAVAPEASFDAAGASLCVAGRGAFFVSDAIGNEIHVYVPDSGIVDTVDSTSLTDAARVVLGPAGRFYAATGGDPTSVLEFDVSSTLLGESEATISGTTSPPPLIVRDGLGRVVRLERDASGTGGNLSVAFGNGSSPPPLALSQGPFIDFVCGPDGRYWILAEDGGALVRVEADLSSAGELSYLPALEGAAMAFAPYRFRAVVAGKLVEPGKNSKSHEEKRVFFTVFPGSGIVYVEFEDDAADDKDLASRFGVGALAYSGDVYREKDGRLERFIATRIERAATVDLVAHASLRLRGNTTTSTDYFKVDAPRGELTLSRGGVAFTGRIESAKRLE